MSNLKKTPSLLTNSKTYNKWLRLLDIWRNYTSPEKSKHVLVIVLSLKGKAQKAAWEILTPGFSKDNGVDQIIE